MDLLSGSLGDKMSPTLDNDFSPNGEAILIQLLIVMTSMKSKGITINTNLLKQFVKGQSYGVQIGAFLVCNCHEGMGRKSI